MICNTCKSSYAQHELRDGLCLDCTRRELERAREALQVIATQGYDYAREDMAGIIAAGIAKLAIPTMRHN